ncbi:MAG: hypothetical protein PHD13_07320 [Methanocellales archaeon]|nr:hypothetical protein [Methanocellales archaeon]MDD5235967.1 hypothetical protein [Methanocellales archaeon]MDD5484877.1 hypothetical protein [Methanocellales archaeon]
MYDGVSPIGAQMTATVQNGKFSATTFDTDITEKSYTVEAKVVLDNKDVVATKSFTIASKTLTLSAPSTVVEGNEITVTGTATAKPTITVNPAKGTLYDVYYNPTTKGYSVKWSTQNATVGLEAAPGNYEIKALITATTLEQKATVTVIGATLTASAQNTVLMLKTDITGESNRQKDTPVFIEVTYPNGITKFNNANDTFVEDDGSYKWEVPGTYLTEKGTYKVKAWTDLGQKWYADASSSFTVSDQEVTITLPSRATVLNEFTVTGTANQGVGTTVLLFKGTPSAGATTNVLLDSATLDSSKAYSKKIQAPTTTGSYKITAVLDTNNDGAYNADEAKASANILIEAPTLTLDTTQDAAGATDVKITGTLDQDDKVGAQVNIQIDELGLSVWVDVIDNEYCYTWDTSINGPVGEVPSGTYNVIVEYKYGSTTMQISGSVVLLTLPPNISWNMTISATNQLDPVVVGMDPNASDGYDPEYDVFSQTPVQGKVILILDDLYSTSIKKTRCYNETVSWNFSVGVPTGQTTTLSWNVPSSVNLTIFEGAEVLSSGSQLSEGSHELTVMAELGIEFCIDLKAGWNMVSLPIIPDNCSVDAIFGSISTLDTMPVVTWESPSFVLVTCIEPKTGYWVFTPSDTTISVTGEAITDTTLILGAGWNMVGTVGTDNLTISDISNQVTERPAVTWVAPSFIETTILEPGKSAWVFVTTDTTVTTVEAVSTEVKAKVVPTITSATITDEWNLTISATNQLEPITFGIHPNATNGYDAFDTFVQTPIQGKVILILDDIYATEINKDELAWNLSVGVPEGQTSTLTWSSSNIPADVSLTLDGTDMKLNNSMDLGEGSHLFEIRGNISEAAVFDTGTGTAPSTSGTHNGTITPLYNFNVSYMYTYPCAGTGGHAEYVKIWNSTWNTTATWTGYSGDYHNITFGESFILRAGETYNYTIKTGSYPQIIHATSTEVTGGTITCTQFTDVNGVTYNDWIPAIRLE